VTQKSQIDAFDDTEVKHLMGLYHQEMLREAEAFASRVELADRLAFLGVEEVPGSFGMEWRTIRGETSH
jgi:hypothetical protein